MLKAVHPKTLSIYIYIVIGLVYSNLEQRKKEDGKKESDTKFQIPGLKLEVRKSASVNKKERYNQKNMECRPACGKCMVSGQ